jgi:negative regulator of flagellin synthesis FlgM
MKITHNKVGQNLNLRDVGKSDYVTKSGSKSDVNSATPLKENVSTASTGVDLSPKAQQLQKAKEAALNAPDINREKVERLKAMVQSGTYKVDADAVAERMLNDHLEW